jgi:hypothetical protein
MDKNILDLKQNLFFALNSRLDVFEENQRKIVARAI